MVTWYAAEEAEPRARQTAALQQYVLRRVRALAAHQTARRRAPEATARSLLRIRKQYSDVTRISVAEPYQFRDGKFATGPGSSVGETIPVCSASETRPLDSASETGSGGSAGVTGPGG